jgi:hypothetical protein
MKRYFFIPLLVFSLLWAASPSPAIAQEDIPPGEAASGVVLGKIINQNKGSIITGSTEVMLHIWDKEYVDLGMEHGQSKADGTFEFSGVAFDPERLYAVMTTFENVTYYSDIVPGPADSDELELTVPVIETTTDLAAVRVDQIHLLFDFVEDGIETSEIYIMSNLGERTVKGAVTPDGGQTATLRFPLPKDADFIFFQPDGQDRFIKFPGGFADVSPLIPGDGSGQFMVQYLVPFSPGREYSYTAPVDIQMINFLLLADSGISLEGQGLSGPQPYTLQSGKSYQLYTFENINAGDTVQVTFQGKPATASTTGASNSTLPLALGGVILGLTMVGVGVWWWRRPEDRNTENGIFGSILDIERATFDEIITEIARLDEAKEQGLIGGDEHSRQRKELLLEARKNLPPEFR